MLSGDAQHLGAMRRDRDRRARPLDRQRNCLSALAPVEPARVARDLLPQKEVDQFDELAEPGDPFPCRPVHAGSTRARRRITHPERELHPPAAEVIDGHGGLGQRDRMPEVEARDQRPDPDTCGSRRHQGECHRTVEHRVLHAVRLHDRVAIPQHVEPEPFGVPPALAEHVERQVLVLVGAEA